MIKVEVVGSDEIARSLDRLFQAVDQPVDMLDAASNLVLERIRMRYNLETDPDGQRWKETDRSKRLGARILYQTGTLYKSISIYSISPNERAIGTDVEYGMDHNFGLNGQVQRTFLGFSDQDITDVETLVVRRISELL